MASNIRFLSTKTGVVHAVTTPGADKKNSKCPVVKRGHTLPADSGGWGRRKSLDPDVALAMDDCSRCDTYALARQVKRDAMTPAQKRAEAKDRRDQTLENAKPVTAASRRKVAKRAAASSKQPADRKPKARTKSKVGDGDASLSKAKALVVEAEAAGWHADIEPLEGTECVVVATRDDETIRCYFIDGKFNRDRHATTQVGSWTGRLRGVHGVRKQMVNEGRDRPHPKPGAGRSSGGGKTRKGRVVKDEPVTDDEPDEEAEQAGLPFDIWDADEPTILEAVAGRTIRWRNSQTKSIMQAIVPSDSKATKVVIHPKRESRLLEFFEVVERDMVEGADGEHAVNEVLGGQRTVALDRLTKVT